jgi:hypothetical protein
VNNWVSNADDRSPILDGVFESAVQLIGTIRSKTLDEWMSCWPSGEMNRHEKGDGRKTLLR